MSTEQSLDFSSPLTTFNACPWPADLTLQQFVERFEQPRQPVVITGLCDGWAAVEGWTPERLLKRFGDHKFKVRAGCSLLGTPSLWASWQQGVNCFMGKREWGPTYSAGQSPPVWGSTVACAGGQRRRRLRSAAQVQALLALRQQHCARPGGRQPALHLRRQLC